MTPLSPDWFQDWSKDICVIIASGPSAKDIEFEPFRGAAKFIAVNNSWKLVPWADVLVSADGGWWNRYKGVPNFPGLKVTLDFNVSRQFEVQLIKLIKHVQTLSTDTPGIVGSGGNSGFYALNLAIQFGSKKIVLVGFDMHLKNGVHWHGPHEKGLNNPNEHRVQKWRKSLDQEAEHLKKLGVEVINASLTSALKAYPKLNLKEAMEKLKCL